ncbi:unnamed protein product [Peniophora sp. CBMAI 1063]|nr:unnamed protein product [Peniophora sp. CBMAI 1063]
MDGADPVHILTGEQLYDVKKAGRLRAARLYRAQCQRDQAVADNQAARLRQSLRKMPGRVIRLRKHLRALDALPTSVRTSPRFAIGSQAQKAHALRLDKFKTLHKLRAVEEKQKELGEKSKRIKAYLFALERESHRDEWKAGAWTGPDAPSDVTGETSDYAELHPPDMVYERMGWPASAYIHHVIRSERALRRAYEARRTLIEEGYESDSTDRMGSYVGRVEE